MSLKIANSSLFQQYVEPYTGLEAAAALEFQLESINNDKYLSRLGISVINPVILSDILNNKETLEEFFKNPEKFTFSLPEMDARSVLTSLLQENFKAGSKQPYRLHHKVKADKTSHLVAYTLDGKCIGHGKDADSLFKEAYCRVQETVKNAMDSFFKNFKHWTYMKESFPFLRYMR